MKRVLLAAALGVLVACSEDDAIDPNHLEGTLSLELRDELSVVIDVGADGRTTSVALTASAGYGLVPVATRLAVSGSRELLPEANGTLYTAKLDALPQPGGPCGAEPVSLALSLHRQGANATVMGGIAAYCGSGRWHGRPVRILRVAGELPIPGG